jgi:ribose-phosphate pyrophosphokinase
MSDMHRRLKVFTGNGNPKLAEEIATELKISLGSAFVGAFMDGEIYVKINESVRGADVFIIQPTSNPSNENLMELLIMIDALKRASADRITAVIPYYGYARQDRKVRARDPITAKLVADIITAAGANRLLTMDLHAGQIQGFFNFPVDHLLGVPILADYINGKNLDNIVVVSPDLGGVTRARHLADRLQASIAILEKRRPEPNLSEVLNIIGDVKGKTAIITDDIIDTGGTVVQGAEFLLQCGAREVYICATHGVFSGPAIERLSKAPSVEVIITNTIHIEEDKKIDNLTILSTASVFAEAMLRINQDLSVSKLFD